MLLHYSVDADRKSKSSGGTVSETLPSTRVGQRTMKAAARMKLYYKGDHRKISDMASVEVEKVSSPPMHTHAFYLLF